MNSLETIRVFIPIGHANPSVADRQATAPRAKGPVVVGLLDNHKHNTGKVLGRLQQRLQEKYTGIEFISSQKPEAGKPAPQPILEQLARECQVVINGIGD